MVSGRGAKPRTLIIDSQSVKTNESGGVSDYDANKKVKARKRHISVDTQGNLPSTEVHSPDIQDRDGAPGGIDETLDSFPTVARFFADGGYSRGKLQGAISKLDRSPQIEIGALTQAGKGLCGRCKGLVRGESRSVWLGPRCRRFAKDWENTLLASEAWFFIAAIRRTTGHSANALKTQQEF